MVEREPSAAASVAKTATMAPEPPRTGTSATVAICYVASLLAGVACIGVGCAALAERARFNPIYRDIYWKPGTPVLNVLEPGALAGAASLPRTAESLTSVSGLMGLASSVSTAVTSGAYNASDTPFINISVPIELWNPNPYHIVVRPKGEGTGYIVSTTLQVAKAYPQEVTMPKGPGGDDYSEASMSITVVTAVQVDDVQSIVSALTSAESMTQFAQGYVNILFEYAVTLIVQPDVFGNRISVSMEQAPKCKVPVNVILKRVESTTCGKSWEEIGISGRRLAQPPSDAKKPNVKREAIDDAQSKVNMNLGALAGLCMFLGFVFFAWPARHWCKARAAAGDDSQEVGHEGSKASSIGGKSVRSVPSAKE